MGLRILLASDYYPPYIGGVQRQTQLLAHELHQRGHEVQIITPWRSELPLRENDGGIQVIRVRQLRTLFSWGGNNTKTIPQATPFPEPIMAWEINQIIKAFKPDIVHSFGWITYSCALSLIGKNIPLLISARDYCYSCPTRIMLHNGMICDGPNLLKCLKCAPKEFGKIKGSIITLGVHGFKGLILRNVTTVHSISSYVDFVMKRDLLRLKEGPSISASQNFITTIIPSFRGDLDIQNSENETGLNQYLDLLPEKPFILFVGGLRLIKGIGDLIDAYTQLNSPPPLVLIGYQAPDEPIDYPPGVIVLKDFPYFAVMAAWRRALFGVMPSKLAEPLGSVIHEGMSQGKAVIGTTPGGHTDMIVDGVSGYLIPVSDVPALKAAMQKLIDNPELCKQMGKAAGERAKLFTAQYSVPAFEKAYQQTIDVKRNFQ